MINEKYFKKLPYQFDISKLQKETLDIIKEVGFQGSRQISLVHRKGFENDCWRDGCGSPFQFDKNRNVITDNHDNYKRRFEENQFKYINSRLEGTEIENVYQTAAKNYEVARYRIALLPPKTCYGWHKDHEIRIHIPIFTAPGCFIITEDNIATHLEANGKCTIFYASNGYHTALNSDYSSDRIHLLINLM